VKIATGEAANSFVAIVLDQCVFIPFLPIPLTLIYSTEREGTSIKVYKVHSCLDSGGCAK